jgi:hypothetical protein
MTEYKIVLDGLHAFGVEVTSPSRFLSVRGFPTEAEAQAWIADQEAVFQPSKAERPTVIRE